jgi:hypothetical protein
MKNNNACTFLLLAVFASLAGVFSMPQESTAQSKPSYRFSCQPYEGTPNVVVGITGNKTVPVIVTRFYSGRWNAEDRCVTIAERMQQSYNNNTLELIGASTMNGEQVICTGANCSTLLITLLRSEDAKAKLDEIMNNVQLNSPKLIPANGYRARLYGKEYFNVGAYLSDNANK